VRSGFERLSLLDRNNLWLEAPDTPMHIMAVLRVDAHPLVDQRGQLKLDQIHAAIEQRLSATPRLRQIVKPGNLLTGPPVWIDEVAFDLRRHVRVQSLPPPGTERQLLDAVARIDEQRLDRSHALWELWVLPGLAGGNLALVFKLHHAIADGLAAVRLMASLFDFSADGSSIGAAGQWQPRQPPGTRQLIADNLATAGDRLRRLAKAATQPPLVRPSMARVGHQVHAFVEQSTRAPKTTINRPISGRRLIAVFRIPLADARAIAHAHGGKINDLLLALIGGGIRALLSEIGEPLDGLELQASVPVSLRHDLELGNQVGAMVVALPIAQLDAHARLLASVRASSTARRSQVPAVQMMAWTAMARLGLGRLVSRRQRFVNLFVTNVAGPPLPVYVLGARVLDVIPVTPIAGNCSIGFGAISYDGCFSIAVVADAERWDDLDVVITGMSADWLTLVRESAGAAVV
jgi:diacylglycerol O-acyltransferase / wax synthase